MRERIGPPYGYPRFSTHAYAALFQAGRRLVKAARAGPPKAQSIAVITNAAEPRLDNRFTYRLIDSWRGHRSNSRLHGATCHKSSGDSRPGAAPEPHV